MKSLSDDFRFQIGWVAIAIVNIENSPSNIIFEMDVTRKKHPIGNRFENSDNRVTSIQTDKMERKIRRMIGCGFPKNCTTNNGGLR